MKVTNRAARLLGAAAVAGALTIAMPASAQRQIVSAVNAEPESSDPDETVFSAVAGELVGTSLGGSDVRVLTDYGVNKVFARGTSATEVYGSSAWLDTFTVGGAAGSDVQISFSFTVDGGLGGLEDNGAEWNYQVFALRGGDWAFTPYGEYDSLQLKRVVSNPGGRVTYMDARDFEGFFNYANVNDEAGALQSNVQRLHDNFGEYYQVISSSGPNTVTTRYYETFFQRQVNGGPLQTFLYSDTSAGGPQALVAYNNVRANYPLLATGGLCAGPCSGMPASFEQVDPFTFTLDFNLSAGSVFTLASWLYVDDVRDATVDFFNTAKVTGVTVSQGGSLTSASGALAALPGGGYGYPAALESAVPEPATWAMMLLGFGGIGYAIRRRRKVSAGIRFA